MSKRFLISYGYADASNYKAWGEFVVSGSFGLLDIEPFLFDAQFFIPQAIGLRSLTPTVRTEDDHDLHSFFEIESTERSADLSATELIRRIRNVGKDGWFKALHMPCRSNEVGSVVVGL